jgi:hypothetical protein
VGLSNRLSQLKLDMSILHLTIAVTPSLRHHQTGTNLLLPLKPLEAVQYELFCSAAGRRNTASAKAKLLYQAAATLLKSSPGMNALQQFTRQVQTPATTTKRLQLSENPFKPVSVAKFSCNTIYQHCAGLNHCNSICSGLHDLGTRCVVSSF